MIAQSNSKVKNLLRVQPLNKNSPNTNSPDKYYVTDTTGGLEIFKNNKQTHVNMAFDYLAVNGTIFTTTIQLITNIIIIRIYRQ